MKPQIPAKSQAVGAWFAQNFHTPNSTGRIDSVIGQRYGDPLMGRCNKGNGVDFYISDEAHPFRASSETNDKLGAISFWIFRQEAPSSKQCLGTGLATTVGPRYYYLNQAGKIEIVLGSEALANTIVSNTVVANGKPHHVLIQGNVSSFSTSKEWTLELWIDGELDHAILIQEDPDKSPASGAVLTFTDAFSYGKQYFNTDAELFDLRFYHSVFEESEVKAICNYEMLFPEKLFKAWSLEEGAGDKVYDWSGNERHGTRVNATEATFQNECVWVPYSFLNEKGFSKESAIELGDPALTRSYYDNNGTYERVSFNQSTDNKSIWIRTAVNSSTVGDYTNLSDGTLGGQFDDRGRYCFVADFSGGTTWNICRFNGQYEASSIELEFEVSNHDLAGDFKLVSLQTNNYTLYHNYGDEIKKIIQSKGGSSSSLGYGATAKIPHKKAWYELLTGSNPTHGEGYADFLYGSTGVTSADFQEALSKAGIENVQAWIQAMEASGEHLRDTLGDPYHERWSHMLIRGIGLALRSESSVGNGVYRINVSTDEIEKGSSIYGFSSSTAYYHTYNRDLPNFGITNVITSCTTGNKVDIKMSKALMSGLGKVPFNALDNMKDANNKVLSNSGKLKYPIQLTESNCFQGDGESHILLHNKQFVLKSLEFIYEVNNQEDYQVLIGRSGNNNHFLSIDKESQKLRYRWNGLVYEIDFPNPLRSGDYCLIELQQEDQTNDYITTTKFVNHTQNWDVSFTDFGQSSQGSPTHSVTSFNVIGAIYSDAGVPGYLSHSKIFNVQLRDGGVIPLCEGKGNVIRGVEGNGNLVEGTIHSESFHVWGKQDKFHYQASEGVWENEVDIADEEWFIITVDTTLTSDDSTDDHTASIGLVEKSIIDWGDGTIEVLFGNSAYEHKYDVPGQYQIKYKALNGITTPKHTDFGNSLSSIGDHNKLIAINQWGNNTQLTSNSFTYTSSLDTIDAQDAPVLTSNLINAFYGCSINEITNISSWDFSNVTSMNTCFLGNRITGVGLENADFSNVTNMSYAFHSNPNFNIDTSNWDLSNVRLFTAMFHGCKAFEGIGVENWNVSKGETFINMFSGCDVFNRDVSNWNMSSATSLENMFRNTPFNNGETAGASNTPLTWDVSNVQFMSNMFFGSSSFNQPLKATNGVDPWDVRNVQEFGDSGGGMFMGASSFNQYIGDWDTSGATNMSYMFKDHSGFNQDISTKSVTNGYGTYTAWNTSSVTNFFEMFRNADSFNLPLTGWDTSAAVNMEGMFSYTALFNQNISHFDLSSCTDARRMFKSAASFNNGGSAITWNTSNVNIMDEMFYQATAFNQPLNNAQDTGAWDFSSVTTAYRMFSHATSFNQYIGNWNTSSLVTAWDFFNQANAYNQVIDGWNFSSVTSLGNFLNGTAFSNTNYDALLVEIDSQSVQDDVTLGAQGKYYTSASAAETARGNLITNHNWIINDNGGV